MFRRKKDVGFRTDDLLAFFGKGVTFKGVLTYDGTVRIDGKIEGEIITTGILIVGETGHVDADVTAASVICSGTLIGTLRVQKTVRLLASAVVMGNIHTPSLTMEPGAQLNGQCSMTDEAISGESARPLKIVGSETRKGIPHVV
jgi:cytoskeletal protein CcmA (bactofilin family)